MGYAFILEPRHAGWRCLAIVSPHQETGEHVASRVRLLFSGSQGNLWYRPGRSAAKANATISNFELPTGSGRGQIPFPIPVDSDSRAPPAIVQTRKRLIVKGDAKIKFFLGRQGFRLVRNVPSLSKIASCSGPEF
jgi:hypothetical protein